MKSRSLELTIILEIHGQYKNILRNVTKQRLTLKTHGKGILY